MTFAPAPHLLRIDAAAVADADTVYAPGSILVESKLPPARLPNGSLHGSWSIIAVGSPAQVSAHTRNRDAEILPRPDHVLLPGLVNAHTHLDLTLLGPRPFDPETGFLGFVDTVRRERPADPESIRRAVLAGAEASRRSGVVAVGDIGGAPAGRPAAAAYDALRDTQLSGVGYIEFFAIGASEQAALERTAAVLDNLAPPTASVRPGLQPHATNTVSPEAYRWAIRKARELGLPIATHLAETPEEHEFIASATGPQRELLERVGAWHPALLREFGLGKSPVTHFADAIQGELDSHPGTRFLAAHVNDLGPDLPRLIRLRLSVVYCPRASDYFGAASTFGPHPYARLLEAGVNVALGTDSIINLPPQQPGLSILDEMRFLHARDATASKTLIAMATVNGASALGLPTQGFRFQPGLRPLGLIAVPTDPTAPDPVAAAWRHAGDPELIVLNRPAS